MHRQMRETDSKFLFSLDIKRVEQEKRMEERQRREEERKAKVQERSTQEEMKKSMLIRKLESSESRKELVSA